MTTFSDPTFSATKYASFRPTYPETLYTTHLLPYHLGARNTLLDLGCGPGTVSRPLSTHFTSTLAIDPSKVMLAAARSLTPLEVFPSITYRAAAAEDLPFVLDGAVDMVVAAQAAHWFDLPRWWAEMARVVRPGGTVAVWGYTDIVLPGFPEASRVIAQYMHAEEKLGGYWAQPGRGVVEGRMRAVRPLAGEWGDVCRWEYVVGGGDVEEEEEGEGVGRFVRGGEGMLRTRWRLREVVMYLRTWSAVHKWVEMHPGVEEDVVDEMMKEVVVVEGWGEGWGEVEVEVEWGHGVVLARRR